MGEQIQRKRALTIDQLKQQRQRMVVVEEYGYNAVSTFLNQQTTPQNYAAISLVRRAYNVHHRRFSNSETVNQTQTHLFIAAFQYEYDYVENQVRDQQIDHATASALREQISYDEIVYMQNSRD
ncbi:hypothetical protein ACLUXD_08575 [Loigolactobacillus coryniformis subsp. coryniformis]|uniref:hypothetical protein n=1 Tax=Loigolactobacillus coryniformis TaxID=1610 RepID=UPI0039960652